MDAIKCCRISLEFLEALSSLLFQFISIGMMHFIHLAFDFTPRKGIWYQKIRLVGGPADVREMSLCGNISERTAMEDGAE
jgi:hypothetical protein